MKKTKLLMPLAGITALGAVVAPVAAMSSCARNSTKITITFDYGFETEQVEINSGSTVAKPADPTYDVANFTGWFTNKGRTEAFDFNTRVAKSMTLYAGWELKSVEGVILDTTNVKREYYQGEKLDLTNLGVKAVLDGGSKTIDVPDWLYTSSPSTDEILTEVNSRLMVTIFVGGATAQFSVSVQVATVAMEVTTTISDYVAVGETVSRDDFTVMVRDTSTLDWHQVYTWECDDLPYLLSTYTFDKAEDKTFNIKYGNMSFPIEVTSLYTSGVTYNLPYNAADEVEFTLNRSDTTDRTFESVKLIPMFVLGEQLSDEEIKNNYEFEVIEGSDFVDVVDGYIYTKAAGTAKIQITDKEGVNVSDPLTVHVENIVNGSTTPGLVYKDSNVTYYTIFDNGVDENIVIPEKVVLGESADADVVTVVKKAPDTMKIKARDLYFPRTLTQVYSPSVFVGSADKLTNIIFDGSVSDWNDIAEASSETTFYNDTVTGVQCNDAFTPFQDCAKMLIKYNEGSSASVTYEAELSNVSSSPLAVARIQIDLTDVTYGELEQGLFTDIQFTDYNDLSSPTLSIVVDTDTTLVQGTHYTIDYKLTTQEKTLTIHFTDAGLQAIARKNVVITTDSQAASNPGFSSSSKIISKLNTPASLNVKEHRREWKVGNEFNTNGLRVNWVFQDGDTWKIPNKYLDVYMGEIKLTDTTPYEFQETDKGFGKVLTVVDKIFGLTTTYTINVR